MMMAPAKRNENCSPMIVSTGIIALRNPCRQSACRADNPLARAVRMKSSPNTSSSDDRMTRARIAACGNANAIAGSVSARIPAKNPASHPPKPPAENHRRLIAKIRTSIIANQKFGMATPSCVAPITPKSPACPLRDAAKIPAGKAIRVDSVSA